MRKSATILVFTFITIMPVWAQSKTTKQMEKRIINPWQWQDKLSYAQAIEVTNAAGTLYCSGQAAMDADGKPSSADMKTQLVQALQNLERVIREAGYEPKNIVRLNIFTTSEAELFTCFDIFQAWIAKHGIKQATTLLGVKSLYETLKIEFEATVVK
jgi:2-iminobutanoate/2-iminopropanoate deaminase